MSRCRHRTVLLFAILLSSAVASTAWAQSPPASNVTGNQVTPPRALSSMTVDYPAGAKGSPQVTVILVIDSSGTVTSADAASADEPFRSQVEEAARRWKFAPATRAGAPVAAKIRVLIPFAEPAPVPLPPPEPEASAPAPVAAPAPKKQPVPAKPPPPQPINVTVLGARPPAMRLEITRAEGRLIPGTFGDPLRVIETLPGVTPVISGAPYFFVRGAPPGQVGNFLDGIALPQLYHVALGPSVIPPGLIDRVQLYPGGYPARYGRFVGGIVEAQTVGQSPVARGEGQARLTDIGGLVEVPFAGGRGSILGGGRYSYAGAILRQFAPDVALEYWDYQARASFSPTKRDTLMVFALGSHDYLGTRNDGNTIADTTFHRVNLRWDRSYDQGSFRQNIVLGKDRSRGDVDTIYAMDSAEFKNTHTFESTSLSSRSEVTHRLSEGQTVHVGMDVVAERYDAAVSGRPPENGFDPQQSEISLVVTSLFPRRTDYSGGIWAEATLKPAAGIEVSPGVRMDAFRSMQAWAVSADARLGSRFKVSRSFDIVHAFGTVHQAPSFVGPVPGVQIAGLRRGLQKSLQHSAGVETDLGEGFNLRAMAFQNIFLNMSDVIGIRTESLDGFGARAEARALGSARGIELYLRRSMSRRVGGFVAYTLSRSTRSVGRDSVPSAYDRTHVLQAALSVALGRGWRTGSRAVMYTGIPTYGAEGAPERTDTFFRLDLRAEKRWILGEGTWMALVLEAQNVTLSKEVLSYLCGDNGCEANTLGPLTVPNIALEAGF